MLQGSLVLWEPWGVRESFLEEALVLCHPQGLNPSCPEILILCLCGSCPFRNSWDS